MALDLYPVKAPASVDRSTHYSEVRKRHDAERSLTRYLLSVTATWKSRVTIALLALVVTLVASVIIDSSGLISYLRQGRNHVVTSASRAIATPAPGLSNFTPTQLFLAKTLREVIRAGFAVSPDTDVIQDRFETVYRYLADDALTTYQAYLANDGNARNPYVLGKTARVTVLIVRITPDATNAMTFTALWQEATKEVYTGALISRQFCEATFTFSRFPKSAVPMPQATSSAGPSTGVDDSLDNIDDLAIVTLVPSTSAGISPDDCGLIV